jgi:hypothetical protein
MNNADSIWTKPQPGKAKQISNGKLMWKKRKKWRMVAQSEQNLNLVKWNKISNGTLICLPRADHIRWDSSAWLESWLFFPRTNLKAVVKTKYERWLILNHQPILEMPSWFFVFSDQEMWTKLDRKTLKSRSIEIVPSLVCFLGKKSKGSVFCNQANNFHFLLRKQIILDIIPID